MSADLAISADVGNPNNASTSDTGESPVNHPSGSEHRGNNRGDTPRRHLGKGKGKSPPGLNSGTQPELLMKVAGKSFGAEADSAGVKDDTGKTSNQGEASAKAGTVGRSHDTRPPTALIQRADPSVCGSRRVGSRVGVAGGGVVPEPAGKAVMITLTCSISRGHGVKHAVNRAPYIDNL